MNALYHYMSLDEHPVVQKFNAFLEAGHGLADNPELTVEAYTLHGMYYKETLDTLISKYYVSPQDIASHYAHAISVYVKRKLLADPCLIEAIARNNALLGLCLRDLNTKPRSNHLYNELCAAVQSGLITDIRSYYRHMVTYHIEEVISEGW